MIRKSLKYRWLAGWLCAALVAIGVLTACNDHDDDEPHPATLYNICDIADVGDGYTVFHLYRPDADQPVVLTAEGVTVDDKVGESGLLGYYPEAGKPYVDSEASVTFWKTINNRKLQILNEDKVDSFLEKWPSCEPVEYLAGWRGGSKIYLRLQLPYSSDPRTFSLVALPGAAEEAIPTLYLYHQRSTQSPTFDRQYYFAFDIAPIWDNPDLRGVCLLVYDNLSAESPREFLFNKND